MPANSTARQLTVGHNFRDALKSSPWSRKELAQHVGLDQSTFTYWSRRGVSPIHVTQVARALDVEPEHILNNKGRNIQSLKTKKISEENKPETRSINLELLELIAEKRLSKTQETIILSVANNFLQEQAA
jgi:DNA-binding Xre family transcriptional regulator